MKQVYKITYPTGKIYIGKDSVGSARYMGSGDLEIINADFEKLPKEQRLDYTIRKQILWESETATESELSTKKWGSGLAIQHLAAQADLLARSSFGSRLKECT